MRLPPDNYTFFEIEMNRLYKRFPVVKGIDVSLRPLEKAPVTEQVDICPAWLDEGDE